MTLQVQTNVSLQSFNTLRIDAQAAEWVEVRTLEQVKELPALCRDKAVLVLGGGSNIVLAADFPGLVILNRVCGIECLEQTSDSVRIKVGGGENWDQLVEHTLQQGWFGLENLSAIPGTVGAAPVQNIGAYGVELKDLLESVDVTHLADGRQQTLSNADCHFAYRDSIFKSALHDKCLITHVTLRLKRTPDLKLDYGEIRSAMQTQGWSAETLSALQLRQIITQVRARKLPNPAQLPNVGSFFKNPVVARSVADALLQRWPDLVFYPASNNEVKIAAGWLLDRLGWKGRQEGCARVHDKQALVLINAGTGAADLLRLKQNIQDDVLTQTGIELEVEPRIIGWPQ